MIYDCFTFFNELDLLEIRLHTLKDVVDKFVIAEATRTYTGKPKALLFAENRERFSDFADKIIYVRVDDLLPEEEVSQDIYKLPWVNENRQRNALIRGLSNAEDNDVIIVSDVDEIPRPGKIPEAVLMASQGEVVRFEEEVFGCFLNFKDFRNPWWYLGSVALSWKTFHKSGKLDGVDYSRYTVESECQGNVIQKVRFLKPTVIIRRAGWHFTYMGGVQKIKEKLFAFSHQEAMVALGSVEARLFRGENVLNGRRDTFAVPLAKGVFPEYVVDNSGRFSHLILNVPDDYYRKVFCLRIITVLRGVLYRSVSRLMPVCLKRALTGIWEKINFR